MDELIRLAEEHAAEGFSPGIIRIALAAYLAEHPNADVTKEWIDRIIVAAMNTAPRAAVTKAYNLAVNTKSVICNAAAVTSILTQHPILSTQLWFDSFRQRLRTTWEALDGAIRDWHDSDTQRLLIVLQRDFDMHRLSRSAVEDALGEFGSRHTKHEVQDWIKALAWDATPRLEGFLTVLLGASDTPYIRSASRNFWLSLMARIWLPGCQVDNMLVLEGPQGQGKTKALRTIGGSWYSAMACSVMDKDFYQLLQGKLVIELAELDSFQRAELTRIKQAVSSPSDTYRASYGRYAKTVARQCIFVGTTNEETYLRDHTGARRFWPVRCGEIDQAALTAQRDQLFAEAYARFKTGTETWWQMPTETQEEQADRQQEDAWETPIAEFLLLHEDVTMKDILTEACQVPLGQIRHAEELRAGRLLRRLGWRSKTIRRGEMTLRRWVAPTREPGEELHSGDFKV